MKKTVYTKAGQVGLVEVERPHIEAPDDVILRIVRTCVCGLIYGATAIQILKRAIKIVVTKLLGSLKKLEKLLQR
jgi:alcohol dehydrogenase, zinc-containing